MYVLNSSESTLATMFVYCLSLITQDYQAVSSIMQTHTRH